jgi:hypothetical protein
MWRRDKYCTSSRYLSGKYEKYGEIRIPFLLSVEGGNESRHLIFWLLGTLTGLRDRVRGLIV